MAGDRVALRKDNHQGVGGVWKPGGNEIRGRLGGQELVDPSHR